MNNGTEPILPPHIWNRTDDDAMTEIVLSLWLPTEYHKKIRRAVKKKKITLREYVSQALINKLKRAK